MPTIRYQRTVDAPTSVVWDVITDHELYAEAAPNLTSVEVIDGEADTMVRRCVDTDGNTWTETCTRWNPEQGFAVRVDVAESDFHRRLFTRFEGEWSLAEAADGVVITIAFDFTPRYGLFGRLISWFLSSRAPGIVERIFDRWETAIDTRRPFDASELERWAGNQPARGTNALYP